MQELWSFQEDGIKFVRRHRRVIIADEMGVGKTRQAIEVLKAEGCNRILIICSKNAMFVWQRELSKWWPERADDFITTEKRPPEMRRVIWERVLCVVTTHQILLRDFVNIPKEWDAIVIDEPHKWLRNRRTKTFKALRKLGSDFLIMMTGTPASKGAGDLWPMLYLCDRKQFTSYWRFVNNFCYVDDGPFGKDVYGTKNIEGLKSLLSKYMIRRLKREVFPDMPLKLVDLAPIIMDQFQYAFHDKMLDSMVADLEGKLVIAPNTLVTMMRLRQMLVCPKMLNPDAPYGAGIEYLQGVTSDMDKDDRHFTIFTPFKKALPFIGVALEDVGAHMTYMQGGMSVKQIAEQVDEYNEKRGVMVCVIKCAEAFSLASASLAYFLGAEWDPTECAQAEDRMHRPETVETVNIHYLQYKGSVEDRVMELLSDKSRNVRKFMTDPRALQKLLQGKDQ